MRFPLLTFQHFLSIDLECPFKTTRSAPARKIVDNHKDRLVRKMPFYKQNIKVISKEPKRQFCIQFVYRGLIVSQILLGLSGIVETLIPPIMSAIWFPPEQRATATVVMMTFDSLGGSITSMVGESSSTADSESQNTNSARGIFSTLFSGPR